MITKIKNNQNILSIPISKVDGISDLLEIVANDGKMGKKTDKYYILSTDAKFQPTGQANIEFYNQLLHYSQMKGFSYIQITF